MNKSTLGTILGVGLLSLMKRQSGSSLRLTTLPFCKIDVFFEMNIPLSRSLTMTNQEMWDLEIDLIQLGDNLGFDIVDYSVQYRHVDDFDYSSGQYNAIRFEMRIHLDIDARKTVGEASQIVKDRIKEIISIIDQQVVAIDNSLKLRKLSVRNPYTRTSDPMDIYNVRLSEVIEYNWNRTNSPTTVNVMVPIDDDYNQTYTFVISVGETRDKVVNADTGGIYKKPESSLPKLRKR